ncbi:MAG: peptide chain release factor aRF-1 [Nanoarchaeota archaeon]|nr:peptide chain release factor aRF-1 [Nanoarchaeota archaeon]MBU1501742.1 peptide chain release factor aRF-1 [Nanoarchaeota archaeon]MBU2459270.1 peptide chain release factor aRF-1 [Nanoarchaeota archaeon]
MPLTKSEVEEIVEELEKHKGRATELITVYIPAGQNIYTVADQLESEKSTAKNIKSTGTRKNVGNALDKITRYLKDYNKTPENGLAIFCGNVSKVEGQDDLQLWDIEPPKPLKMRMYRCDKEFVLEPLKEMLQVTEVFGLLVMDRKEATIGMLEGKKIEVLHKMTSGIPSKVRAGGQSSQRFHRITEGLTKTFYKRIAEEMKSSFFEMKKLGGIIIGGPIPTKDEFIDGEYLATALRQKIIGRLDIGDSSESGLQELVQKAQDLLMNHEMTLERKDVEKLFLNLGENPAKTLLGEGNARRALQNGAVEILYLSSKVPKPLTKELSKMAENTGAEVKVISTETTEGEQFFNLQGGIGMILRFEI